MFVHIQMNVVHKIFDFHIETASESVLGPFGPCYVTEENVTLNILFIFFSVGVVYYT